MEKSATAPPPQSQCENAGSNKTLQAFTNQMSIEKNIILHRKIAQRQKMRETEKKLKGTQRKVEKKVPDRISLKNSEEESTKNKTECLKYEAARIENSCMEEEGASHKLSMREINETTPVKQSIKNKDHSAYFDSQKFRHVCEYCQKVFKSNGKLNSHVYSHTGEKPYDCNNCGKAFSSKFKLVRHLLIHSEVRKFVCQICSRTFLRNDHLKNHYKVHDPLKKMYKCPRSGCGKEYSSLMSHKKHMAVHNIEDGDLKCLICGIKCETKEEILHHLKTHSGSRLLKSQSDKKFKCEHCDRLFLTRKDVTRHLVVHTGERDFLCQFCPQRFGRKDHLVRHIRKSHMKDRKKKEETKARMVISVDREKKKKSTFQAKKVPKNEVPFCKKKTETRTTQIFLQNVPNVFIIPNNSIILLRNQKQKREVSEPSCSVSVSEPIPEVFQPEQDDFDFEMFKNSSFSEIPDLNSGFDDSFDFVESLNENVLTEASRQIRLLEGETRRGKGVGGEVISGEGGEGGELLRNLLTSNTDSSSPLPGFSQIFNNANPSSS